MQTTPDKIVESIIKTEFCNRHNIHPSIIGFTDYIDNGEIIKTSKFKNNNRCRQTLNLDIPSNYKMLIGEVYDDEQRRFIANRIANNLNIQDVDKDISKYITKEGLCVLTNDKDLVQIIHPVNFKHLRAEVSRLETHAVDLIYDMLKKRFKCDMKIYFSKIFTQESQDAIVNEIRKLADIDNRSIEIRPLIGGRILFYTTDRVEALKVTSEKSTQIRSNHWKDKKAK